MYLISSISYRTFTYDLQLTNIQKNLLLLRYVTFTSLLTSFGISYFYEGASRM
jgi:hypothetical protein